MRGLLTALIISLLATHSLLCTPERYIPGIPTVTSFLQAGVIEPDQSVVGLTGFYGQDQPREWLILVKSNKDPNQMYEFVVSDGQILGKRRFTPVPGQDIPTVTIPTSRLKVDSSIAFEISENLAKKAGQGYDSVHYQLRSRDLKDEPVWLVNQLDTIGRSVGVHYISAETGRIFRSVWQNQNETRFTKSREKEQPVRMLYGGTVTEVTISGKSNLRKERGVSKVINPQ